MHYLASCAALAPCDRTGPSNQRFKQLPARLAACGELGQVHSVRQRDWPPPGAHQRREALRGTSPGAIGIEDTVDGNRVSKGGKAFNGHVGTADGEGRQVPTDRGEKVQRPLNNECTRTALDTFQAKDWSLARERQVFRSRPVVRSGG